MRHGFIENRGQLHDQHGCAVPEVTHLLPGNAGLNIQIKADGFCYDTFGNGSTASEVDFHRLEVTFIGCDAGAGLVPSGPELPGLHYITGTSTTLRSIATAQHAALRRTGIYPGIDLVMSSGSAGFKYDLDLAAGALLASVRIRYTGFDRVEVTDDTLRFVMGDRSLTEAIPCSWRKTDGGPVQVRYRVLDRGVGRVDVGFETDDPAEGTSMSGLIIDPLPSLKWATYHGDSLFDEGTCIALDALGNVFVAGNTASLSSIATVGAFQATYGGGSSDVFVSKRAQNGHLLWCTYLGGSDEDVVHASRVIMNGGLAVVGGTRSEDWPVTTVLVQDSLAGGMDAFVTMLGDSGQVIWSTLLGGDLHDEALACDADLDELIIGGVTESGGFLQAAGIMPEIGQAAGHDGFIVRLDTVNGISWGTYYGGSGADAVSSVRAASNGSLYASGSTRSDTGIATPDAWQPIFADSVDAFVVRFDSSGTRDVATYFGGPGLDSATGLAMVADTLFITGITTSVSLAIDSAAYHQTEPGGSEDGFLARFDSLQVLRWAIYVGDSGLDRSCDLAADMEGALYVAGSSASDLSIATPGSAQSVRNGGTDGFVMKFDPRGQVLWGTYFGGPEDEAVLAVVPYYSASVFITGGTSSSTSIAFAAGDPTYGGGGDAFVARFKQRRCHGCAGVCVPGGGPDANGPSLCLGDSIMLAPVGGDLGIDAQWVWYEGSCGDTASIVVIGDTAWFDPVMTTTYFVRAESPYDTTACFQFTITVEAYPTAFASGPDSVCADQSFVLQATGGAQYEWTGPGGLLSLDNAFVLPGGLAIGTAHFQVIVSGLQGCSDTAWVDVEILPVPQFTVEVVPATCHDEWDGSAVIHSNDTMPQQYEWPDLGSTVDSVGGLPAGMVELIVTNSIGCSVHSWISVTEPPELLVDAVVSPATCAQPVGSILLILNADPALLEFTWTPPVGSGPQITGLPSGVYAVEVSDQAGCLESMIIGLPTEGWVSAYAVNDTLFTTPGDPVPINMYVDPMNEVISYEWSPPDGLSCADCPEPIASPDSTTLYTLEITSTLGCELFDQVLVVVDHPCPADLFLPNVFSPNGDGTNDLFCVRGGCLVAMELIIHHRWGGLIFHTIDPSTCWDGSINGIPAGAGTYAFIFHGTSEEGNVYERSGSITLVR